MPFIRMEAEVYYKFNLTNMLLRLRRSIWDGDYYQDLILSDASLCCSNYPFPSAQVSTCCDHSKGILEFKHRFLWMSSPSPVFVSWHWVEAFFPSRDRGWFYVPTDCPEWYVLETSRVLKGPSLSVFSYYSHWVFENSFRHLIFTIVRSKFAVSTAVQFLRVATNYVFLSFLVVDRARPMKPLLSALLLSFISLLDCMLIKEKVFLYAYNLVAGIIAWETIKTGSRSSVSPSHATQRLHYDFARGAVSFFPSPWNIRATVRGVQHQAELVVLSPVPWQRLPPTWAFAPAAAFAFLSKRFPEVTTPPSHSP